MHLPLGVKVPVLISGLELGTNFGRARIIRSSKTAFFVCMRSTFAVMQQF